MFIEIKTNLGQLNRYQEVFKEQIESHGGNYWVIRSLEDINDKIQEKSLH